MTVTPAALAICSMCAPVPESSGQMISTVAPLAMADCAMLTCVASLPRASWTVRFADGSPAAANAAFRAGASNASHRVDEVVSGRMTATLPLPSGASGASALRALNVGPMSLTVRDGAPAVELEGAGLAEVGAEVDVVPGLEAAMSSAVLRPAVVRPALFLRPAVFAREDKNVPRFSLTCLAAGVVVGRRETGLLSAPFISRAVTGRDGLSVLVTKIAVATGPVRALAARRPRP